MNPIFVQQTKEYDVNSNQTENIVEFENPNLLLNNFDENTIGTNKVKTEHRSVVFRNL